MIDSAFSFILRHFVWVNWIVISTIMIVYGVAVNVIHLSPVVIQSFVYGKALQNSIAKSSELYFAVPKRWFKHFYIFASIYLTGIVVCVWKVYFFSSPPPLYLHFLVKLFLNSGRPHTATPEAVIIASVLILLQVYRRCYECHFVSIFSDSRMNVIHYIVGYLFYFGVGLSFLSEAPGFTKPGGLQDITFKQCWLQWNHVIGVVVFLWAWNNQLKSHIILAGLRKDNRGKVITLKHATPEGSLFNFVTNPHYFCEIVLYLSIQLVLGYRNITWWLVCVWVISCHAVMALSSHEWYKKKFPSYAERRKALIPYIL